jgi:hypothetical protein
MTTVERELNTILGSTFIFDNELESISVNDKVVLLNEIHCSPQKLKDRKFILYVERVEGAIVCKAINKDAKILASIFEKPKEIFVNKYEFAPFTDKQNSSNINFLEYLSLAKLLQYMPRWSRKSGTIYYELLMSLPINILENEITLHLLEKEEVDNFKILFPNENT